MSECGAGGQGEGLGDSEASWKPAGAGPAGCPPWRHGARSENQEAGHGHRSMLKEGGEGAWTGLHAQNKHPQGMQRQGQGRGCGSGLIPFSEVSPHSPQQLKHQAENVLHSDL